MQTAGELVKSCCCTGLHYIYIISYYYRDASRGEVGTGYHIVAVRHCLLCCCCRHCCIALWDMYPGVMSSACIL